MIGLQHRWLGAEDGKYVVQVSGETDQTLKAVQQARDMGLTHHNLKDDLGMRLTHRLPMIIYHKLIKESGLPPGNVEEFDAYVAKRLATGEFDAFKVYEGQI